MAGLGNQIVVKCRDNPLVFEGKIAAGETPKPGTMVQMDVSEGLDSNGRMVFEAYNADADGARPKGPLFILLENSLEGVGMTTAYAAGQACRVQVPLAGEEYNMLFLDVAGTGDDIAIGDIFIADDSTGKLLATTGTPETEMWMSLEAITNPMADVLVHCIYTGY